jgi:hypothetical protein
MNLPEHDPHCLRCLQPKSKHVPIDALGEYHPIFICPTAVFQTDTVTISVDAKQIAQCIVPIIPQSRVGRKVAKPKPRKK